MQIDGLRVIFGKRNQKALYGDERGPLRLLILGGSMHVFESLDIYILEEIKIVTSNQSFSTEGSFELKLKP